VRAETVFPVHVVDIEPGSDWPPRDFFKYGTMDVFVSVLP
jgi:hypothetical protein